MTLMGGVMVLDVLAISANKFKADWRSCEGEGGEGGGVTVSSPLFVLVI